MMWELIQANRRRSAVLVALMGLLLCGLGYAIGGAIIHPGGLDYPPGQEHLALLNPAGGMIGAGVAGAIWAVQAIIAYLFGGRILMAVSRAREIEKADHPQLFNVVEEMTIASGLGKMPKVYIIDDMSMNAFAAGRSPDDACVAVTAGLLGRLNRDELQGVVAHEIAHIVHRDVLYMTMVGIMAGTIVMISEVVLRSLRYGAVRGGRYAAGGRGRGNNQGAIILLVLVIVLAIVAPLLARLIYFAVSRKREYLADAGAAVYTRYPEGLASALERITGDPHPLEAANSATAPMYIVNPLQKSGQALIGLFSTHPPTAKRVAALRAISGGVSYGAYRQACARVNAGNIGMPKSAVKDASALPFRAPLATPGSGGVDEVRRQMREAGDLLHHLHHFTFLACACGMKMKLPPNFPKAAVPCPRCQATLRVPAAGPAPQAGAPGAGGPTANPPAAAAPLRAKRNPGAWTTIQCACGATKNLAPNYAGNRLQCGKCGRAIELEG